MSGKNSQPWKLSDQNQLEHREAHGSGTAEAWLGEF